MEEQQASISMVQRRLRIGYNWAARLIDRMEKEGVVGPADGANPRDVFIQRWKQVRSAPRQSLLCHFSLRQLSSCRCFVRQTRMATRLKAGLRIEQVRKTVWSWETARPAEVYGGKMSSKGFGQLWVLCSVLLASTTFFALGPVASSRGAESNDAEAVVDALQNKVNATADFIAEFRQETEIKTLNRTIKASGKVYFKRPGKMLWRYDEPKGQYVLADGKDLYMYQPEQAQIIKTPLRSAFRSDVPLSFLLGIGSLRRDFQYRLKASEKGVNVIQLTPKSELGQVGELLLGVDARDFELQWVRIQDAVGNVTSVRFSSIQRGVGVKDSLFHAQIPQGVEVVELGSAEGP